MSKILEFTVEVAGKELTLVVKEPTLKDNAEAKKVENRTFRECMTNGDMTVLEMDKMLDERGIWTKIQKSKYEAVDAQVKANELKISKGRNQVSRSSYACT